MYRKVLLEYSEPPALSDAARARWEELVTPVRHRRAALRELVLRRRSAAGEPTDAEAVDAQADAEYRALMEAAIAEMVKALGLA